MLALMFDDDEMKSFMIAIHSLVACAVATSAEISYKKKKNGER
jgi:hypothetical protein